MNEVETKSLDAPQSMRKVAGCPARIPVTRRRFWLRRGDRLKISAVGSGVLGYPCGIRERKVSNGLKGQLIRREIDNFGTVGVGETLRREG